MAENVRGYNVSAYLNSERVKRFEAYKKKRKIDKNNVAVLKALDEMMDRDEKNPGKT